jgi:hypothetical protein
LLVCAGSASAQVTLEKRYDGALATAKLSDGNVKYYQPNVTSPVLRIYNQDHSIFRILSVPVVTGVTVRRIDAVSDKLMNQDAALEYVAVYGDPNAQPNAETDKLRIWTETGGLVLAADTVEETRFYNTPQGTKMIARGFWLDATNNGREVTKVYSVGGTYTPLKTTDAKADAAAQPWPNPAVELVRLPYQVKADEIATLRVYDAAGCVVTQYQVNNQYDHLALDTRKFSPGVYVYRVEVAGAVTPGQRFIVR